MWYNKEMENNIRFGRWEVIRNTRINSRLLCRCDCGTVREVKEDSLKRGVSVSCGCLRVEMFRKMATTHGLSTSRIYRIWCGMKERCENPNYKPYKGYGAVGIKLCEAWHNFDTFLEWSFNNGYSTTVSIDRIDTYGNYEPSNCRWVDRKTQQNNRKDTHYLTAFGETKPLMYWLEDNRCTISEGTLRSRLSIGWEEHKAISTPRLRSSS